MSALACAIGIHLATYHTDRSQGYNEFNPGIYAECEGPTIGTYYNSVRERSTYIGWTEHFGPFSLTAGFVSGYHPRNAIPMLIPSVKVGNVRIMIVPLVPEADHNTSAIHLAVEF